MQFANYYDECNIAKNERVYGAELAPYRTKLLLNVRFYRNKQIFIIQFYYQFHWCASIFIDIMKICTIFK